MADKNIAQLTILSEIPSNALIFIGESGIGGGDYASYVSAIQNKILTENTQTKFSIGEFSSGIVVQSGIDFTSRASNPGSTKTLWIRDSDSHLMRGSTDVEESGGSGGITTNTTYYIATTGSDVTGDGSSGTPWATPQKALDYLKDKWINDDVTVTIQCADGTYALTSTIDIEHPCGARISIVGQNTYTKTLSSVQSSSGSAGAWSIVLNLSNVTNIATNDYVRIISTSGGVNPVWLRGLHKVTNVDAGNSRITITSTHNGATAPSGAVACTNGVMVFKTIFDFSDNTNGIYCSAGNTLGNLNKVVITSSYAMPHSGGIGIYISNGSVILGTAVGIAYLGTGVKVVNNGYLYAASIAISSIYGNAIDVESSAKVIATTSILSGADASEGQSGIYVKGAYADISSSTITGLPALSGYGIYVLNNGNVLATSATINSVGYGVLCEAGFVNTASSTIINAEYGIYCQNNGSVITTSATITYCSSYGIYSNRGFVSATSVSYSNNGENYYPFISSDNIVGWSINNQVLNNNSNVNFAIVNASSGIVVQSGIDFVSQAANPGGIKTIWIRDSDGHLMRGSTDVEDGGGASYDQSLNTTDNVKFTIIEASSGIVVQSGIDFTSQASNPGGTKTVWIRDSDGHLMRGTTDVEAGTSGGLRDTLYIISGIASPYQLSVTDSGKYISTYVSGMAAVTLPDAVAGMWFAFGTPVENSGIRFIAKSGDYINYMGSNSISGGFAQTINQNVIGFIDTLNSTIHALRVSHGSIELENT